MTVLPDFYFVFIISYLEAIKPHYFKENIPFLTQSFSLKSITFDNLMETHVFIDKVDQLLKSTVGRGMENQWQKEYAMTIYPV